MVPNGTRKSPSRFAYARRRRKPRSTSVNGAAVAMRSRSGAPFEPLTPAPPCGARRSKSSPVRPRRSGAAPCTTSGIGTNLCTQSGPVSRAARAPRGGGSARAPLRGGGARGGRGEAWRRGGWVWGDRKTAAGGHYGRVARMGNSREGGGGGITKQRRAGTTVGWRVWGTVGRGGALR